jgi:TPR repeat protein
MALRLFRAAAEQGHPAGQLAMGEIYEAGELVAQDFAEAARLYRLAGDQGHDLALVRLAVMALDGRGGAADPAEAARLFGEAAELGNDHAQAALAGLYLDGIGVAQDYAEAIRLFALAAEQGNVAALSNLGWIYENAYGVEPDLATAAGYYRRAADLGEVFAQRRLAHYYRDGLGGVAQDIVEAAALFRLAAEQGDAEAQNELGVHFYNGFGVEQDLAIAAGYYRRAADLGAAFAQRRLAYYYRDGLGGNAQDNAAAATLFRLAAEAGDAEAQNELGCHFYNGLGVAQNRDEAVRWFRLAADQGQVVALINLGILSENGDGVERDYEAAARFYRLAAGQDWGDGFWGLGGLTENGLGVAQDYDEAERLYRRAIELGATGAQEDLDRLVEFRAELPKCLARPRAGCLLAIAYATIAAIPEPGDRVTALLDIARAMQAEGDDDARAVIARAIEMAGELDDPPFLVSAYFSDIAVAQAEIGDVDGALTTLAAVTDDPRERARASMVLVKALLAADDIAAAIELATAIQFEPDDYESPRAAAFLAIAHAQLGAGNQAGTLEALYEASEAIHALRFLTGVPELLDLAVAEVEAGYFHAGIGTAMEALGVPRWDAIRAVFAAYGGDTEAALQTIDGFDYLEDRAAALLGLVPGLIGRGSRTEAQAALFLAVEAVGELAAESRGVRAYTAFTQILDLAKVQLLAGDDAGADETMALAAGLLPEFTLDYERGRKMVELAAATADATRRAAILADALTLARQLAPRFFVGTRPVGGERVEITFAVAEDRARAGDVDGALALIGEIAEVYGRTEGYVAIARIAAESGDPVRAVEIAGRIANPVDRVAAFLAVAAVVH